MGYVVICICLYFVSLPSLAQTLNTTSLGQDCNNGSSLLASDIQVTATSELSQIYEVQNILKNGSTPWVGNFTWPSTSSKNLSIELHFNKSVWAHHIRFNDSYASGFHPNVTTKEKCFVKRFVLDYKKQKEDGWRQLKNSGFYKKFNSETGNYMEETGLAVPIVSLRILIRTWENCPAVRNLDIIGCEDEDECKKTGVCGEHGNCTNTAGSYRCDCEKGYVVKNNTCTDDDECKKTGVCGGHGNCTNTAGSYTCDCKKGYVVEDNTCKDDDECKEAYVCGEHGNCTNTAGSYKCDCKEGYEVKDNTCTEVNECNRSNECNTTVSKCKNLPGSYICTCNAGYTAKDNIICEDNDECEENPCSAHSTCKNNVGSYLCECDKGFTENEGNCIGVQPKIDNINSDVTVKFGESFDLYCNASGLPVPLIRWEKNGASIHNESRFHRDKASSNDAGVYTCVAWNDQGSDMANISVYVDGKPAPPGDPKIIRFDEESVKISWLTPDQGASTITGYGIVYTAPGTRNVMNVTQTSALLDDLRPNTKYEIMIYAINDQGESEPAVFEATTHVKVPSVPPDPQDFERVSSKAIRIFLTPSENNESGSEIQIIVGEDTSRNSRKKRQTNPNDIPCNHTYNEAMKNNHTCYITGQVKGDTETFEVGDGKTYGGYLNQELEPGNSYEIFLRSVSTNSENVPRYSELSEPLRITAGEGEKQNGGTKNVVGIIAGICVAVLIIIILVIAVLYVRSRSPKVVEIDPETGNKKRRKRSFNTELLPLTRKTGGKRKSSSVDDGSPDPNHPPVPISSFAKFVGKLHKSDDRGFMIQYNTLESNQTYPSETAQLDANKDKNRYANIIAYDVSRVHLKRVGDDENTDYINASYVDGYNSPNAYIATQGPLECTFNDFWRMVWEKNCPAIVMLTNLQERHKIKCHKYWPDDSEQYGDITATCTRREQYADYVIRTFHLKMNETEEEREIKQFHFTVWPDHGVPEYPTAILAFHRRVRTYCSRDAGPLVVHCSAGVGRSGTFIVIDSMLARIQHEKSIDIYNYVRYLRTRRMFMVQTEEQYVFCHDALLESILCGNTQIAAHNLRIGMKNLRNIDETTNMSGYEKEFKTLERVSPTLPKECFVIASYPDNKPKNRYSDILAPDHGRVALTAIDEDVVTTYINAVFVDGYKQQNAFILTQSPLTETVKDFWRLIHEKRSACIVLLNDLSEAGDFPQFWPESGSKEYDALKVEVVPDTSKTDSSNEEQIAQDNSNDIVARKLKITKNDSKPLVVKMFQHLSWKETVVPSDVAGIISLVQHIEKWQQSSGNAPITVICNDGVGRSGTFAALSSVLERVKTEQVVDVFQAIKALRIQRPGLVKNVDQYEFIHNAVQEYLDSFSDYANFK